MAEISKSVRDTSDGRGFLTALRLISAAALLFCVLSVAVDWLTGSGSYLEDGVAWLYDGAIYGLAAISFGRGAIVERTAAAALAFVLVTAGCQGAYDTWSEIFRATPDALADSPISTLVFATGAVFEAALLFNYRKSVQPLMQGTWLSAGPID